jgi:hypothetical protein
MKCQTQDELVNSLTVLNSKLNLLSPELVYGEERRAEIEERRQVLIAEIKQHRRKGHNGNACPAVRDTGFSK